MEKKMADDVRTISFEDPDYAAAVRQVLAAVLVAQERDGGFQNGFSALLINIAMMVEREPGTLTNKQLREKCELLGRTVLAQAKMLREQHESTGKRMFDQLTAEFDAEREQTRGSTSIQ
jgi:hypothetical protein